MKLEKLFRLTDTELKSTLCEELLRHGYEIDSITNSHKFLYAEGDTPYMLVAHLDTVHKNSPSLICYSKDGNYMMSPQGIGGDDRCGVYIILSLLNKLSFKPYVLFTMDEEIGGLGAKAFIDFIDQCGNQPELKYIVEYDRKGNKDCVFYNCDNKDFTEFVEQFGFKTAYGTFTDISVIAPKFGVAAVNLSSGYYNPHTNHEVVSIFDMKNVIAASINMLTTECDKFEYVAKYVYQSYSSNTYQKRKVSVSFVPPNSVYIYSYYKKENMPNVAGEVVIDELGNYYRYNRQFGDISSLSKVEKIEGAPTVVYNPLAAVTLPVFGY